jgi:16S rRNA (guanine527-N7)-methyltransferase
MDPMTAAQRLAQSLEILNLKFNESTQASLLRFLEILLRENEKINLTGIKTMDDGVTKHLVDSLAALSLPYLNSGSALQVMDLGSGSGMPGLALTLAKPEWSMILIEGTKKKARFLETAATELGLEKRVRVEAERAELLGQGKLRDKADLVTCRALGRLNVVLELAVPLLKVGGKLIAYKGPKADAEITEAAKALKLLGAKVIECKEFSLPMTEEGRSLVVVEKINPTNRSYPRSPGMPAQQPIV